MYFLSWCSSYNPVFIKYYYYYILNMSSIVLSMLFSVCISVRIIISYLVYSYYNTYGFIKNTLTFFYLSISIGILYKYFTSVANEKGPFNQDIWWNSSRVFHSILYFITFLLLLFSNKYAFIFPVIDAGFGLMNHIHHHYILPKRKK